MNGPEELNCRTQPLRPQPVFNNWDVVAEGWYFVCRSRQLRKAKVRSFVVCGQKIALFRGADGRVRAVDAYCPHLGADLALGKVVGCELQCFFHQWKFNGDGKCTRIPASPTISPQAHLRAWAVEERYGMLWVNPSPQPKLPVPEVMSLDGQAVRAQPGKTLIRKCHHHINMINGIDPQHLRTVHQMQTDMQMRTLDQRQPTVMEYVLDGKQTLRHPLARLSRWLTGGQFQYSMRFADGCIGCISVNEKVRIRGLGWSLPAMHMIFAYRPDRSRRVTEVQTIHVVPRHAGVLGWLLDHFLLIFTNLIFRILRDEDGLIYDNIRFRPNALLPMDAPISQYMAYVNRLEPSVWSARRDGDPAGRPG